MDSKIEQLKTLLAEGEKYTFQNSSSRDVDYDRSRYGAEDTPEWLTWKTCRGRCKNPKCSGLKIPIFLHNSYASRNIACGPSQPQRCIHGVFNSWRAICLEALACDESKSAFSVDG
jgi:hypothetical protein